MIKIQFEIYNKNLNYILTNQSYKLYEKKKSKLSRYVFLNMHVNKVMLFNYL